MASLSSSVTCSTPLGRALPWICQTCCDRFINGRTFENFRVEADLIPSQFRGEALAAELSSVAKGQRVLWARATRGRDVIPEMLTAAGIHVEQLAVYDNRDVESFSPEIIARLKNHSLDWIGLSSPSIARRFADLLQAAGIEPNEMPTKLVTISPSHHQQQRTAD